MPKVTKKNFVVFLTALFLASACMKASRKATTPGNRGQTGGPTGTGPSTPPTLTGKPPAGTQTSTPSTPGGSNTTTEKVSLDGTWEDYNCTNDPHTEDGSWNSYKYGFEVKDGQLKTFYSLYSKADCQDYSRMEYENTYFFTLSTLAANSYEIGYFTEDSEGQILFSEKFAFNQDSDGSIDKRYVGFTSEDYDGTWWFVKTK